MTETQIYQSAAVLFRTYCLGTGCMDKCKTCQHEKNWQSLNQLPDALRKPVQNDMLRMAEGQCQITSCKFYAEALP